MVVVLLLMWNVVGPFKTGNLDDWEEVEEIQKVTSEKATGDERDRYSGRMYERSRYETIVVKIDTEMIEEGTIEKKSDRRDRYRDDRRRDTMTDTAAAAADMVADQDRDPENKVMWSGGYRR